MHIPDGYLGPPTWLGAYAACVPLWGIAARKVRSTLDSRRAPILAIAAAFSFLVMMFNIPVPGGTSGHAVGGVLVALVAGPWGASLAVSIALVIQALVFGDGGVTAIGANCLDMAFLMPFSGYYTYRLLARLFPSDRGRALAAGAAGWAGLNVAAFGAAVMFGLQPLLHTGADGRALYAPYPLSVAVPGMMIEHILLFGIVEGIVTGVVIRHLLKSPSAWVLLRAAEGGVQ